MSYKVLQLSPRASTRNTRRSFGVQEPWFTSSSTTLDIGFLSSLLEGESDFGEGSQCRRKWGAIYGLALSVVVSGAFWAGVAWMASRVWR